MSFGSKWKLLFPLFLSTQFLLAAATSDTDAIRFCGEQVQFLRPHMSALEACTVADANTQTWPWMVAITTAKDCSSAIGSAFIRGGVIVGTKWVLVQQTGRAFSSALAAHGNGDPALPLHVCTELDHLGSPQNERYSKEAWLVGWDSDIVQNETWTEASGGHRLVQTKFKSTWKTAKCVKGLGGDVFFEAHTAMNFDSSKDFFRRLQHCTYWFYYGAFRHWTQRRSAQLQTEHLCTWLAEVTAADVECLNLPYSVPPYTSETANFVEWKRMENAMRIADLVPGTAY